MVPFYEWGSFDWRLQSHFEEAVYFLPLNQNVPHPTIMLQDIKTIIEKLIDNIKMGFLKIRKIAKI